MAALLAVVGDEALWFSSLAMYEVPRAGSEVRRSPEIEIGEEAAERTVGACGGDETSELGSLALSELVSDGGEMGCSPEKDIGEEMKFLQEKSPGNGRKMNFLISYL